MDAKNDFAQLSLRFTDPVQHDYELIRPVVLFAEPVSQRSEDTEMERTKIGEKARRFIIDGMAGLGDRRQGNSGRNKHEYPPVIATEILRLKQQYPPIHYREIVRVLERKFGYHTNLG